MVPGLNCPMQPVAPVVAASLVPRVCTPGTMSSTAASEPVRVLNLLLQRMGLTVSYTEVLDDEVLGMWHVQARAGGISARGSGHGKKEAKRLACAELLRAYTELMGSGPAQGSANM